MAILLLFPAKNLRNRKTAKSKQKQRDSHSEFSLKKKEVIFSEAVVELQVLEVPELLAGEGGPASAAAAVLPEVPVLY